MANVNNKTYLFGKLGNPDFKTNVINSDKRLKIVMDDNTPTIIDYICKDY